MATSILDPLRDRQGGIRKSADWYNRNVRNLSDRITARKLMNSGKLIARPSAGRLNMFFYEPKTRARLPYYDVFPLVFPLEPIRGGFLGMNFHYLPPLLRMRLLERMQAKATDKDFDSNTKFDVTYSDVKRLSIVKPTIKKYLYSYVQTGFLRINADEAATAIFLPVQRFKKASEVRVYADSRRFI